MLLQKVSKIVQAKKEVWTPVKTLRRQGSPTEASGKLNEMRNKASKFLSILR